MGGLLHRQFGGNQVLDYAICVGIFIIAYGLFVLFEKVVIDRLRELAKKTRNSFDDFVIGVFSRSLKPALFAGALYASLQSLSLPAPVRTAVNMLLVAVLTVVGIRVVVALLNYLLFAVLLRAENNENRERSLRGVVSVLKILVWGAGIVFLLDNMGFKVSAVIAGLGIGGAAVALAAQAVLGDMFSFFAILFDRPFEVGDFIIVGDFMGSVEYIGIKTTRLRSLGGEQLIFSNTDLTNSRVRNYKRMNERRIVFKLGVVYQTATELLQEVPGIIKTIITGTDGTRFDRAHFSSYGDFNLVVEVVYYVLSPDYNRYMDIQQNINFAIKREFERRNIEFAYPTQTLFVNRAAAAA